MNTEQAKETKPQAEKQKRNIATYIFVYYRENDTDEKAFTKFDTKQDLDIWIKNADVTILRIVRGVEKKMQQRVVFV